MMLELRDLESGIKKIISVLKMTYGYFYCQIQIALLLITI